MLVVVLYLANHETIRDVLDETDFVEVVFEDRNPEIEVPEQLEINEDQAPEEQNDVASEPVGEDEPDAGETEDAGEPERVTEAEEPDAGEEPDATEEDSGTEVVVEPPVENLATPQRTIAASLYFIRVSDDGRILTEPVTRNVRYTSSPLSRSIDALIGGPTADDLNRGLLSLLPPGTVLESARVQDGVAYLSFNERFRFNPMGLEGYLAQLKQVVLTATDFPTVDRVQILVENQRIEYLGGDGVYIGDPLAATDLPV